MVEMTPVEAAGRGATKGELMLWVANQEHKVSLGIKDRPGTRYNNFRSSSYENFVTVHSGRVVAVMLDGKIIDGWIQNEDEKARSIKVISQLSDVVYSIKIDDLVREYSAQGMQGDRAAARRGATALIKPEDFRRMNMQRYEQLLAQKHEAPEEVFGMMTQILKLSQEKLTGELARLHGGGEKTQQSRRWNTFGQAVARLVTDAWEAYEDLLRNKEDVADYKAQAEKYAKEKGLPLDKTDFLSGHAHARVLSKIGEIRDKLAELEKMQPEFPRKEESRKIVEANWKHKINIADIWAKAEEDETLCWQVAAELVKQLKVLPEAKYDVELEDIINELIGIADSKNEDPEEFNAQFEALYDWGDRDHRLWIDRFNTSAKKEEARKMPNGRSLKEGFGDEKVDIEALKKDFDPSGLIAEITRRCGVAIPGMKVELAVRPKAYGEYNGISITSDNFVDLVGAMKGVISEVTLNSNYGSAIGKDDGDTVATVRVDMGWKHNGGGSNGYEICTGWYNFTTKTWQFRDGR